MMKFEEIFNAVNNYELTLEEQIIIDCTLKLFLMHHALHMDRIESKTEYCIDDIFNEVAKVMENSTSVFTPNKTIFDQFVDYRQELLRTENKGFNTFDKMLKFMSEHEDLFESSNFAYQKAIARYARKELDYIVPEKLSDDIDYNNYKESITVKFDLKKI